MSEIEQQESAEAKALLTEITLLHDEATAEKARLNGERFFNSVTNVSDTLEYPEQLVASALVLLLSAHQWRRRAYLAKAEKDLKCPVPVKQADEYLREWRIARAGKRSIELFGKDEARKAYDFMNVIGGFISEAGCGGTLAALNWMQAAQLPTTFKLITML
jgi:hypothetical protein